MKKKKKNNLTKTINNKIKLWTKQDLQIPLKRKKN